MTIIRLTKQLPSKFQGHFDPPMAGAYRPGPRLWEELLNAISTLCPRVAAAMAELRQVIADALDIARPIETAVQIFERDALATAIQTWGGSPLRKEVLRNANSAKSAPTAPFLSRLQGAVLREDTQINHDHATFPGFRLARRDVVGSVVLSSEDGTEALTILNCNRQPLERTLGVDLIYYNHHFKSFVLVQYKRMTSRTGSSAVYSPNADASHALELERMRHWDGKLQALPQSTEASVSMFRLSERPFYIKLCEAKSKSALDAGMISGMYIPLNLWERVLKSPEVVGPKGGISISWESCQRKLGNSEFTSLLRRGWIGSTTEQTDHLSDIIEQVLGNGHLLVLAVTGAQATAPDFRRDGLGRFAAYDDPEGAV